METIDLLTYQEPYRYTFTFRITMGGESRGTQRPLAAGACLVKAWQEGRESSLRPSPFVLMPDPPRPRITLQKSLNSIFERTSRAAFRLGGGALKQVIGRESAVDRGESPTVIVRVERQGRPELG